jgi:hypothetical protein
MIKNSSVNNFFNSMNVENDNNLNTNQPQNKSKVNEQQKYKDTNNNKNDNKNNPNNEDNSLKDYFIKVVIKILSYLILLLLYNILF